MNHERVAKMGGYNRCNHPDIGCVAGCGCSVMWSQLLGHEAVSLLELRIMIGSMVVIAVGVVLLIARDSDKEK